MNKLFNSKGHILFFVGAFFILSSCEKQESVSTSDLDLVATVYDKNTNFKTKKTYSIPDSVVIVSDDEKPGTVEYLNTANATAILNAINNNMKLYNWQKVDKANNPDVILLPSVSTSTTFYYYYSWGYWGWYYPGYSPGWGWYYPGYYPPTLGSYTTGTVFMQMTDPKAVEAEKVPVIWNGVINGLVDNTAANTPRINAAIDQAFKQSPYLKL